MASPPSARPWRPCSPRSGCCSRAGRQKRAAAWKPHRRGRENAGASVVRLQIHGRRATALGRDLVADLLALVQAVHARALDGADMDEHVLAALLRLNEPEALGGIEPLHNTGWHLRRLLALVRASTPKASRALHRPRQLVEFGKARWESPMPLRAGPPKARPSSQVVGSH